MKARSKFRLMIGLFMAFALEASASLPGDKRTILTSGEKVYTIKYQLGQSTVLYFGLRPEIVICGNKNYFNIEKIKDGITIQPLSNFSTNLTVMIQGKRYLFFLMPAGGSRPDGFVEVKWVPPSQVRPTKPLARQSLAIIREIGQKAKIAGNLEFAILKENSIEGGKRRIFEISMKNLGSKSVPTNSLEIVASVGGKPLERQVLVWESDSIDGKSTLKGRLIISGYGGGALSFVAGYLGKSTKLIIKGKSY